MLHYVWFGVTETAYSRSELCILTSLDFSSGSPVHSHYCLCMFFFLCNKVSFQTALIITITNMTRIPDVVSGPSVTLMKEHILFG